VYSWWGSPAPAPLSPFPPNPSCSAHTLHAPPGQLYQGRGRGHHRHAAAARAQAHQRLLQPAQHCVRGGSGGPEVRSRAPHACRPLRPCAASSAQEPPVPALCSYIRLHVRREVAALRPAAGSRRPPIPTDGVALGLLPPASHRANQRLCSASSQQATRLAHVLHMPFDESPRGPSRRPGTQVRHKELLGDGSEAAVLEARPPHTRTHAYM
jgi:hypothetical protein